MEPLLIYSWNPKRGINHHLDIVTVVEWFLYHITYMIQCDENYGGTSNFCCSLKMVQSKILLNVTLAKNNLYCPFTLNKWSTILTYKTTMNLIWNNFGSQINILLFKNVRISVETYFEWEGYMDVVDGCWGQFVLASFSHWKHQHSNDFAIYNCHHHNLWFIKSPANFMLHNVVTSIIVAEWNYYLKQTVLENKLSSEFFGRTNIVVIDN